MDISIIKYDITKLEADIIVNAANRAMLGGGGVDGAIHRAAGPGLLDECLELRKAKYSDGLQTGQVAVTKAHNLKAKWIFHTVGPVNGKDDVMLLRTCYANCFSFAKELGAKSIAFPAISTGAFGVPVATSARIVKRVLDEMKPDMKVILVMHSDGDKKVYDEAFGKS